MTRLSPEPASRVLESKSEPNASRARFSLGRLVEARTLKRGGVTVLLTGVFGDLAYHGITNPRSVFVRCCGPEFFSHGLILLGVPLVAAFGLTWFIQHRRDTVRSQPLQHVAGHHESGVAAGRVADTGGDDPTERIGLDRGAAATPTDVAVLLLYWAIPVTLAVVAARFAWRRRPSALRAVGETR